MRLTCVIALLCLAACDVQPGVETPRASTSSSASASASTSSGSGASSSSGDQPTGCFAPGAALVGLAENTIQRIAGDGSRQDSITLGVAPGLSAQDVVTSEFDIRSTGFVAATAFLDYPDRPHGYHQVLVDPRGVVRWQRLITTPSNPSMFLNDQGVLAISTWDSPDNLVVLPDGSDYQVRASYTFDNGVTKSATSSSF